MSQTFDTYTKHSTAYKLTQISVIVFALFFLPVLILQNKLNTLLSPFWNAMLLAAFVLSLIGIIAGLWIRNMESDILMYIKDGELELDVDKFQLDSKTYDLNDLTKIEFIVIGYRGQAGSRAGKDGTGNKIKIYEKSNQTLEKFFVLNTREQLDNLKGILMQWKQAGTKVKVDGFDLR